MIFMDFKQLSILLWMIAFVIPAAILAFTGNRFFLFPYNVFNAVPGQRYFSQPTPVSFSRGSFHGSLFAINRRYLYLIISICRSRINSINGLVLWTAFAVDCLFYFYDKQEARLNCLIPYASLPFFHKGVYRDLVLQQRIRKF
jgi:hypothetical protein